MSGNRISGLEGVIGDDHDFSDDEDEMGIVGGHATNLDGLDKDQIMKMIGQLFVARFAFRAVRNFF